MLRRDLLTKGSAAAALMAVAPGQLLAEKKTPSHPIAHRLLGKTGVEVSILGFGGTAVMSIEQQEANNLVAEAFDRGINYYDVSPTYGNAEERLGPALQPYRSRSFLACKTDGRDRAALEADLEKSLKTLRTDYFDLYQLHALQKQSELETIFGPKGAMEALLAARQAGKIRYLGFSAHSVETALAVMERGQFDTVMVPINFVLYTKVGFGQQVLDHAHAKGMGCLALKGMAKGRYRADLPQSQHTPKCWYEPCSLHEEAALALRWTLSQPVSAALPPGNPAWFRLAMDIAQNFQPITADETKQLFAHAAGADPLFQLGNNV